jgi:hypothetical protein
MRERERSSMPRRDASGIGHARGLAALRHKGARPSRRLRYATVGFTYRITFSLPGDGNLPPQHEVWMHVLSLVSLFRVDMQDELLAQKVI